MSICNSCGEDAGKREDVHGGSVDQTGGDATEEQDVTMCLEEEVEERSRKKSEAGQVSFKGRRWR